MELQDKIVQFIDDREQQGIVTVAVHVAHAFALPAQDAYTELCELVESGRVIMTKAGNLRVNYTTRIKLEA